MLQTSPTFFTYSLYPLPPVLQLVATASLFLAAKSEEQPRKLQYVAQASYACLHKDQPMLDVQSQVRALYIYIYIYAK